jgi:hypothetical protein
MCHWSFEQLRRAIDRLRMVATWALQMRRVLAAISHGANGHNVEWAQDSRAPAISDIDLAGLASNSTSSSQLSASSSAPALSSSERDP